MRKSIAAAAMAASLTIGGTAGAALFTPTLSGAQTDEATTEDGHQPGDRIADVLAPLVEDGTLTQAQLDAVVEALVEAAPERHRGHRGEGAGRPGPVQDALADALGVTREEMRARLAEGETLREIADAEGVDPQVLVDAIVAEAEERLAGAVEDGRLTQEEADEKLAEIAERAEASLDATYEPGRRGPGHDHGDGDRATEDVVDS